MTQELFTPARLGQLTLKNRFHRSATWDGLGRADGSFSPAQRQLYQTLAKGGAGLLNTGFIAVNPRGRRSSDQNLLCNRKQTESLAEIAAIVHDHGSLLIAQLVHCGGQAHSSVSGRETVAPSAVDHPIYDEEAPREMTIDEIEETISDFAAAACRAREAGCDGVQIHAAHGYLVSQFLSPFSNRRQDEYGGNLAGRARFLMEIYGRIRSAVGRDFTVTIKINGSDYLEEGLEPKESLEVVQQLAELGLDGVEVSGGTPASRPLTPVPQQLRAGKKELPFFTEQKLFADRLELPVIAVGGVRSLNAAEKLQQAGISFISLCRPLIRNPGLIADWQAGRSESSNCISCNRCFIPAFKGRGISCLDS